MVRAAYPDRLGQDDTSSAPMHELGYEVGRLLGADSPIAPEEREFLTRVLNTMLEPYRPDHRPRASASYFQRCCGEPWSSR